MSFFLFILREYATEKIECFSHSIFLLCINGILKSGLEILGQLNLLGDTCWFFISYHEKGNKNPAEQIYWISFFLKESLFFLILLILGKLFFYISEKKYYKARGIAFSYFTIQRLLFWNRSTRLSNSGERLFIYELSVAGGKRLEEIKLSWLEFRCLLNSNTPEYNTFKKYSD